MTMNDWNIKKFLFVILSIPLALISLIGLDWLGFSIPILRQLVAFIYITFVPGIIILRILRLHKLGSIRTILYAAGLSISTMMCTGFLLNLLYPALISMPISLMPLMAGFSIIVLILAVISYVRDRGYSSPDLIDVKELWSPTSLFLCLIPIFSIFSTYLMNVNGDNSLQMALLLVIMAIPVMLLCGWIQDKYMPLAIFTTSLSLLFHTTLITQYIWGADIHVEYYFANLIMNYSWWNPALYDNVDAMLSVVMLAPAYSIISNLDLVWVFKIIYPVLFSFIPLGLFHVYKKYTSDIVAFFACFFFISIFTFYTVMPALARQQIAELFLVNMIILVTEEDMPRRALNILLVIFSASMVVSHYGLSYIFMFILIISWLIAKNRLIVDRLWKNKKLDYNIIYASFILFFIIFTIVWFIYVGRSSIFNTGVMIGYNILASTSDILSPTTSQAVSITIKEMQLFQSIERYIHLISLLLIIIGVILTILNNYRIKAGHEYMIFSVSGLAIAILGFVLPYFASALDSNRLYHITLFFLAPFCIIGLLSLIKLVDMAKIGAFNIIVKRPYHIISVFLIIFLLFNSAFIYQVFNEQKMGRFALDNTVNFMTLNNEELSSANWLKNHSDATKWIYADQGKAIILNWMIGKANDINSVEARGMGLNDSYVYLSTFYINNDKIFVSGSDNETERIRSELDLDTSKIYDNYKSYILIGQAG